MGGVESILVADNGHGINYVDAIPAFENLGGSWKNTTSKIEKGTPTSSWQSW